LTNLAADTLRCILPLVHCIFQLVISFDCLKKFSFSVKFLNCSFVFLELSEPP
jgi:hypothetical protein